MLNVDEIRSHLEKVGIVKLEGFVASEEALVASRKICALAEQHGMLADGCWITSHDRFAVPKAFRNALGKLQREPEFPCLIGKRLIDLIERVVDAPVALLPPGQHILFSLPGDAAWSIPHDV